MTDIILYHYSGCSKSRAAEELLKERGIDAKVVHYLDTPLNAEQIRALLSKLNIPARQLVRTTEPAYSEMGLDNPELSEAQLIEAMVQAPILMQRPILEVGSRAAIGRPLENIIELLE